MFRPNQLASGLRVRATRLALVVAVAAFATSKASAEFRELVARIPGASNAVIIYNVQKILNSPMGVQRGWNQNLDAAFADGIARVPPQTQGLAMAAQLDFRFMHPLWQAAVANLGSPLPLEDIAKRRGGKLDTLSGMPGVELPNDTYVVQLDTNTLAAMGPANRQVVLQWLRALPQGPQASEYLRKAGGYADDAGSEVIAAADLDGAFADASVKNYLASRAQLLKDIGISADQAAALLASVQGVRFGIRIKDKANGMLVVDFKRIIDVPAESLKALLLDVMVTSGLKIGDGRQWKAEATGNTLSLSGYLTDSGLRRLFSLIEAPTPSNQPQEAQAPQAQAQQAQPQQQPQTPPAPGQDNSPSSAQGQMAANTARYFQHITKMFDDLKEDWNDLTSLSAASLFFDRYAKRIEHMPILNVDPDMLKYGDYVASQLRNCSGSVRTMGIRGSYRQSGIGGTGASYGGDYSTSGGYYGGGYYNGYGSGYGNGFIGGYGLQGSGAGVAIAQANATNAFMDATRAQGAQRRAVRNEERATMATDVQTIRAQVIDATNQIRREMTQRYQVEF